MRLEVYLLMATRYSHACLGFDMDRLEWCAEAAHSNPHMYICLTDTERRQVSHVSHMPRHSQLHLINRSMLYKKISKSRPSHQVKNQAALCSICRATPTTHAPQLPKRLPGAETHAACTEGSTAPWSFAAFLQHANASSCKLLYYVSTGRGNPQTSPLYPDRVQLRKKH